jgi:sulfate permease, SulP family
MDMKASSKPPHSQLQRELEPHRLVSNLTAGLITGMLCVALSISLGTLVFSGDLSGYLVQGISLALLSTILVGTVVALFSSLPGMVANTQDAPAAILAVAALGVALSMQGADAEDLFMTVVATNALSTLMAAVLFLILGIFRLGKLVRYLPYPVVGGFLAGTGWLLFTGGIGIMAGVQPSSSYLGELLQPGVWPLWVPGLVFALALLLVTSRVSHYLVWPCFLLGTGALFYLTLLVSGGTIAEWRAAGLLLGPFPDANLLQPIDYGALSRVHWPAVASQAAAAATAVAISLMAVLLNATGLELATGRNINLNQELRAAGIGNLLAGAAGGMIGYQVLSISALNCKAGTGSRLASFTAVALVGITLVLGVSVIAYIPTLLVGGLLVYLGLSFMADWLIGALSKVSRLEYAIIVLILIVIATVGFLEGVGVGVVAAVLLFVINYSRSEAVRHALSGATYQSRVTRTGSERAYLRERGNALFILQLQGYLFFGTANGLLETIDGRLGHSPHVEHVLLDFSRVTGLDATALLSFSKLIGLAERHEFTLILSGLSPLLARQLERHGLTRAPRLKTFATLDEGIEWSESQLLASSVQGADTPPVLHEQLAALLGSEIKSAELLERFEKLEVPSGHYLLRQGDPPDVLYFVSSGQVTARLEVPGNPPVRLETMHGGSLVGELGFYTGGARTASVVADKASTVYRLTRQGLAQMEHQNPELAAALHQIVVRLLADRVIHLMRVVEALQR